jgi:hypothetical protein
VCARARVHTYTGCFTTMLDMVALSHRKPLPAVTSRDICIAQDIDKRDTLFACEFQSSLSKLRTQFKPAVGWVATWRITGLGWVPGPRGFTGGPRQGMYTTGE